MQDDRQTTIAVLEKEGLLREQLRSSVSVLVAFSGGVDSTYLLYCALKALGRERVLAVTVKSPLVPDEEVQSAANLATELQARHFILSLDLLAVDAVRFNSSERCYHCKKNIYEHLLQLAKKREINKVVDGSNADDSGFFRPGLRALRELDIDSPLYNAGLSKNEIRELSKRAGLPTWNKAAASCLASRFPYDEELNVKRLNKIAAAELYLQQLGIERELRVRCHGELVRLEVQPEEQEIILRNSETIVRKLRELGLNHITLDLGGFQSGSMDSDLN